MTENVESNDHCDDAGVVVVVVDNDQISLIVSYIFLYSIRFSGAPAVQCTVYIQNYRKFLSSLYLNISFYFCKTCYTTIFISYSFYSCLTCYTTIFTYFQIYLIPLLFQLYLTGNVDSWIFPSISTKKNRQGQRQSKKNQGAYLWSPYPHEVRNQVSRQTASNLISFCMLLYFAALAIYLLSSLFLTM